MVQIRSCSFQSFSRGRFHLMLNTKKYIYLNICIYDFAYEYNWRGCGYIVRMCQQQQSSHLAQHLRFNCSFVVVLFWVLTEVKGCILHRHIMQTMLPNPCIQGTQSVHFLASVLAGIDWVSISIHIQPALPRQMQSIAANSPRPTNKRWNHVPSHLFSLISQTCVCNKLLFHIHFTKTLFRNINCGEVKINDVTIRKSISSIRMKFHAFEFESPHILIDYLSFTMLAM